MKTRIHAMISMVIAFLLFTAVSVPAQHEQHSGHNAPPKVSTKQKKKRPAARRAKKKRVTTLARKNLRSRMHGNRALHHAQTKSQVSAASKAHEGHTTQSAQHTMSEKPAAQQPAAGHQQHQPQTQSTQQPLPSQHEGHKTEQSVTQPAQKPTQPTQPQHEGHKMEQPATPPAQQTDPSHMQHQQQTKPADMKPMPGHDMSKMESQPAGHDMSKMAGAHDMAAMMSTITGGPFKSMSAIGSGTSLQPSTTPGYMWHWMKGDWMIMGHGDIKIGFNHQGGPRGINKAESQNWFMLMAERQAGPGRLMLRGMFSAEPWTAPRRGFPELFQTGETFKGRPIIDAQHPHDLFMELAAAYNIPLSEHVVLNFYGGPVAEPAGA